MTGVCEGEGIRKGFGPLFIEVGDESRLIRVIDRRDKTRFSHVIFNSGVRLGNLYSLYRQLHPTKKVAPWIRTD